jgi:peptidoglycan/LPS O-acetylase OafA/YrhL
VNNSAVAEREISAEIEKQGAGEGREEAPKTRPESAYRAGLDVLRFVAFFLVFLHHTIERTPVFGRSFITTIQTIIANGGGFGLQLFFTLSAFLICDLLLRERERCGKIRVLAFYKRRALRIWPLYVFALGIGATWALLTHTQYWIFFFSCLLFIGNWYCYLASYPGNPVAPIWSISIEEQFYFLFPVVIARASKRTLYVVCALIILVANGFLGFYGANGYWTDVMPWTNTFVEFEMFAVGILLALLLNHRAAQISWASRACLFAVTGVAWSSAVYVCRAKVEIGSTSSVGFIGGYALIAAGCAAMLLAFVGLKRVPRWLAYLGRISYGLYVYHLPSSAA